MEHHIRTAHPKDAAGVTAIRALAIAESTGLWTDEELSPSELNAWFTDLLERGQVLVAEGADGQVLGYASLEPLLPKSGYRFTGEDSIYLVAEAQGRGLGSQLLAALLEHAREQGFHSVTALIESGNTASISLHERHGYTRAGQIPEAGWKFDRWWDLTIMHRML